MSLTIRPALFTRASRKRLKTKIGLVSLWLCLVATPALATSMVLEGTANLLHRADTVVTGRVISVETRMNSEHQFIYRYVTLEVSEVFKGSAFPGSLIELEELGGQIDRLIHHVPGVPVYEVGEEVLSFLEDREDGRYRTYGMIQGKFRLEPDARGRWILTRPSEWTDTYLADMGDAADLTAIRADGSYLAEPLLEAIREEMRTR
jgi:hypothetical protein